MTRSQRAPEGRADLRISFDLVKFIPFGDGHAGPRIAQSIDRWLEQRSLTRRLA